MKSIIKRTIYTGLGLVSVGADAVKGLGNEIANTAGLSEAEGEKIARKLQTKSSKAAKELRRTLDAEVTQIADMIHATLRVHVDEAKKSRPATKHNASAKKARKAR